MEQKIKWLFELKSTEPGKVSSPTWRKKLWVLWSFTISKGKHACVIFLPAVMDNVQVTPWCVGWWSLFLQACYEHHSCQVFPVAEVRCAQQHFPANRGSHTVNSYQSSAGGAKLVENTGRGPVSSSCSWYLPKSNISEASGERSNYCPAKLQCEWGAIFSASLGWLWLL